MPMSRRTLPERESLTVEFKSDRKPLDQRDLVLAVVCLANTAGGVLYLGVEDDGSITGADPSHLDAASVAATIAQRTVPSLDVRVSVLEEEGKRVTQIDVPLSRSVVATTQGIMQRRRLKHDGSPECVPMQPAEIVSRLSQLGDLDYSARPILAATQDDLDPAARTKLREVHARFQAGSDSSLRGLSDDELDAALGLVAELDGRRVPTVTGLLLLGRTASLRRHLPTHEVLYQELVGGDVRVNEAYRGPLLEVVEALESHLARSNRLAEAQIGLYRVTIPSVDVRAFREAVLNAIVHRDYAQSASIYVQWGDEDIVVSSPGGFVEGVSLDNLLVTPPRPRNRTLADALKRLGLVERTGRGVDLIYAGLLRYGRPPPDYTRSDDRTVTVVLNHGPAVVEFHRLLLEEEAQRGAALSIPEVIVLALVHRERWCTLATISRAIQRHEASTRPIVERLVEAGLLEARGEARSRVYQLGKRVYLHTAGATAYQRARGADAALSEREVLALLAEDGEIKRAEVMARCQLTEDQATRLLRKMVRDGKIESVGAGRGVRYRKK